MGQACASYQLRPGSNQWFTFFSNEPVQVQFVALIKHNEKIELFVYEEKQVGGRIPANPDADPKPVHLANLGPGSEQDGKKETRDILWTGELFRQTRYYARLANRSSDLVSYQVQLYSGVSHSCP